VSMVRSVGEIEASTGVRWGVVDHEIGANDASRTASATAPKMMPMLRNVKTSSAGSTDVSGRSRQITCRAAEMMGYGLWDSPGPHDHHHDARDVKSCSHPTLLRCAMQRPGKLRKREFQNVLFCNLVCQRGNPPANYEAASCLKSAAATRNYTSGEKGKRP